MASALSMMKKHPVARSVVGNVARTGVGFGTSYLLAKHCHGKETKVPYAVAAVGKLIPAFAQALYGDIEGMGGTAISLLDQVGQAGVNHIGTLMGLRSARKDKGVRAFLVPTSTDPKALPAGAIANAELVGQEGHADGVELLGALGSAQAGKTLTLDQLAELQSMR